MPQKTAIIFIGIQASGKSTFYHERYKDYVHINLDTLHTRNKENILLQECVENGRSFVVDNTNPTREDKEKYIRATKDNGYCIHGYYFQSSVSDCIARNQKHEGKARIPDHAVAGTNRKLKLPEYREGFDNWMASLLPDLSRKSVNSRRRLILNSGITVDIRWNDRITYDGTWENNLFNFFTKVTPKLTEDLKKPFKLEGIQRIDETPIHKAVREAFVNLIIHADYLMDAGVLKVIKRSDSFEFTNPGILKLPLEDIYRGGNSKSRNPHMQTMLRMVGFGDNAGSGFPSILATWKEEGWIKPQLIEDTNLNQVTLYLKMIPAIEDRLKKKSAEKSAENQKVLLSERQRQILDCMELEVLYKTEEIAEKVGLKGPRTRQLLNELVAMGILTCTAATKNRRYIKIE